MLEGLDDIAWEQLTHAYGKAGGIPARIRALRSTDPADWVVAISDLYDALCHQMCDIYPATVPAIPFLMELLGDREVRCRGRILEFLANVMFVANDAPAHDEEFEEDESWTALTESARTAVWEGLERYLKLLSDLDRRIRVIVPYLLGAMVKHDVPGEEAFETIRIRMQSQFEEEPNELVRASLVFGLACLLEANRTVKEWLEQQVVDPGSSAQVRMAAALSLAEVEAVLSDPVLEVLSQGLEHPDETNQFFITDQPAMEDRHHPIGRAVLEYQGELTEQDNDGRDEDMKFPWVERWQSGWVSWRILQLLTRLRIEDSDRFVPALVPYLEQATEYTGDSIAIPIWKFVAGDRELSPETAPESLSPAQHTVLLHLFNNLNLWATNVAQEMYVVTGLGNRRADWARVLDVDPGLSTNQIEEILSQIREKQRYSTPDDVKEVRLCSIGTADFLPYLSEYSNLEILDFADTSLTDRDMQLIAELSPLRQLRLNNTPVTDEGIKSLIKLSNLEELYLWGTKVTTNCLESLGQLPKLKYISLSNTGVSKQAAREFMQQHPTCRIIC